MMVRYADVIRAMFEAVANGASPDEVLPGIRNDEGRAMTRAEVVTEALLHLEDGETEVATVGDGDGSEMVAVHRFTVIVVDHEGAGREECRRRIHGREYIDQVFQTVEGPGETVTVEWRDDHPFNLTTEDGNAVFDAELVRAHREGRR